jgi:integrase
LPHIEGTRESSTVRGYRSKVARIVAVLGRHRLVRLSTTDVDRAYGRWLGEGLSPSSVHHLHRVLATALHQAAKWNYVNLLATDRATPPSKRRTIPKVPSPSVIRQLIAETEKKQPVLAAAIALAASTGMRRGELLGLRWDDIDLDAEVIMVRRSLKQAAAGPVWTAGDVKSHAERLVNLDPFSVAVLRRHREPVEGWALAAGVSVDPGGYVLSNDPTGREPTKPDSLGQALHRATFHTCSACLGKNRASCSKCGGTGKVRWCTVGLHSLRHFSATQLVAAGVDIRTVAGRHGHSDPSVTLRTYSHAVPGRDRQAAEILGVVLAG